MKKLLLSILTLTSVFAFAQKDISVTLTTPANNSAIVSGVSLAAAGVITNVGAPLTANDTIKIAITLNGSLVTYNNGNSAWLGILPHGALATGATLNFTMNPALSFTISTFSGASMCAVAGLYNGGDVDNVPANNISCNAITLSVNAGVNDIAKAAQSVKVYPNPAKDVVNFSIDGSVAKTICVMDITGRTIETVKINTNDTQMNIGDYSNGIYIYQIKSEDGQVIKSGKFNVSK